MSTNIASLRLDTLREVLSCMSSIASWRTLALLLALLNIKNLPFGWTIRLMYHFFANLRLRLDLPLHPKGKVIADAKGRPTHPVFVPCTITSRTSMLETDYNMHKSNSTYFADLDVARTALVTRLYSPGVGIVGKELDRELLAASKDGQPPQKKHKMYVALGSVFCSFKREIKPYELYEIESKLIAWDHKWAYVMSFFLRPAKRPGEEKTLLATAMSKYVVKKGRLTVSPERVLRASGFLPPRPEGDSKSRSLGKTSSLDSSEIGTPASVEGITATEGVDGSLVREVMKISEDEIPGRDVLEAQKKANAESWDPSEWTWERIEQERLRGMEVVGGYVSLDDKLYEEWKR